MSDQNVGVAPGTLSGINLAGNDQAPEAALPAEDDRTLGEASAEVAAPAPQAETPQPAPEPEPTEDEPDAPEAEPADEPAPAAAKVKGKGKGAPARPYIVLEQGEFDDGRLFYTQPDDPANPAEPYEIEARNAQNAMRQAFKDLAGEDAEAATAVLVVIPKSMFRPTAVRLARTERVSVQFG